MVPQLGADPALVTLSVYHPCFACGEIANVRLGDSQARRRAAKKYSQLAFAGARNVVRAISAEIRYGDCRTIPIRINSGRTKCPCPIAEGDYHCVEGSKNHIGLAIAIHIGDGYAAILGQLIRHALAKRPVAVS